MCVDARDLFFIAAEEFFQAVGDQRAAQDGHAQRDRLHLVARIEVPDQRQRLTGRTTSIRTRAILKAAPLGPVRVHAVKSPVSKPPSAE